VRSSGRGRERGASLVEFALVVPLLTLFLFGIVQFGIAYDKQQSINSAAREGARLGALATTDLEELSERAAESYGMSAVDDGLFTVVVSDDAGIEVGRYVRQANGTETYTVAGGGTSDDPADMPCGSGSDFVAVDVITPYDITIPFFGVQPVTIDAEAEFRCET